MAQRCPSHPEPAEPPLRPGLDDQPSRFILLEREMEQEYRSRMLESLQRKVDTLATEARAMVPECPRCGQPMSYHDTRPVSWLAHWGRLQASPSRYRCSPCRPYWISWAWNQDASVAPWLVAWDCWPQWRHTNWRHSWRSCF